MPGLSAIPIPLHLMLRTSIGYFQPTWSSDRGVQLGIQAYHISHLHYAGDILIISTTSCANTKLILKILQDYYE